MAKAIALYKGGIHSLIEVAIREDGVVFRRHQNKTPWGYRWSKWNKTGEVLGDNARNNPVDSRIAGFSTLHLTGLNSPRNHTNVRLP